MSSTDTYPSYEQQTLVWPERPQGVKSQYGLFNIIDFMPHEGEDGMVLTVETMFDVDPHRHLCVRLIIGRICTTTTVRTIVPQSERQAAFIRVECTVPDFSRHQTQNPSVPITIQAMDGQDRVVDGITFGNFTYWQNGESANLGHPRSLVHPTPLRPGAVPTEPLSLPLNHKGSGRHARRDHASSLTSQLLRRPEGATPRKGKAEKAALQFINSVEDMSKGFTPEEYQAGRRLVRFSRTQDGNKLCVSCEAIIPDDYTEGDIVASCIIRDGEEPCVTSVDIIALLQRLVQDQFSVEEKNRIRRNLEGFHPATIAKTRPDTEVFFRRIMDFPEPKPRNIEKDVKVFEWSVLPAALEKIIHKYSLFTAPKPKVEPVPSTSQLSAPEPQLQYPTQQSSSRSSSPLSYGIGHNDQPPLLHLDPVLIQANHSSGSSCLSPESAEGLDSQHKHSYSLPSIRGDGYYPSHYHDHQPYIGPGMGPMLSSSLRM